MALLLAGASACIVSAAPADAADRKPVAGPSVTTAAAPSGAELAGRMLDAQSYADPDVPLPRADLALRPAAPGRSTGPSLYGRQEDNGAVVGLKFPIPVSHSRN